MNQFVDPVKVEDPILDNFQMKPMEVLEGGSSVTYTTYNASSSSSSSITFNNNIQSEAFLNRRILLRVPITVSMGGVDPGQKLFQSGKEGLRQYPICSAIDTMTVNINGHPAAINLGDVVHPFQLYTNKANEVNNRALSTTATMRDYYQDPNDGVNSVKNPLSVYSDNSYEPTRGSFPYTITTNTNTAFVADYELTVPIMVSPLQFDESDDKDGLLFVNNLKINISLKTDLFARMWQRTSSANPITSSSITIGTPSILVKNVSYPPTFIPPEYAVYNFMKVITFNTDTSTSFAPGATHSITSDAYQISTIPYKILIWVRRKDNDYDVTSSNSYFSMRGINIKFNNEVGILSSASEQDLYNISKNNGLDVSFQDWHGESRSNSGGTASYTGLLGSVMCIEPGHDIALKHGQAPGTGGRFNLQFTVTCKNIHPTETITPSIYVATIDKGTWINHKNLRCSSQISAFTHEEVITAPRSSMIKRHKKKNMYGGSLFLSPRGILRDFENIGSTIGKIAKGDVKGAVKKWAEHFPQDIRELPQDIRETVDLVKTAKSLVGGTGIRGGAKMSPADLRKRLRRM